MSTLRQRSTPSGRPDASVTEKGNNKGAAPKGAVEEESATPSFGGVGFNSALLGFIVTLHLLDKVVGPVFASLPAASTKPYTTFDAFFPFYLEEHSELTNRRLHFIGTTISLLIAASRPRVLLSILYAGFVGLYFQKWLMHQPSGVTEAAVLLATFLLVSYKWTNGKWLPGMAVLLVGYTFAWYVLAPRVRCCTWHGRHCPFRRGVARLACWRWLLLPMVRGCVCSVFVCSTGHCCTHRPERPHLPRVVARPCS
jgi:hypothetical protein